MNYKLFIFISTKSFIVESFDHKNSFVSNHIYIFYFTLYELHNDDAIAFSKMIKRKMEKRNGWKYYQYICNVDFNLMKKLDRIGRNEREKLIPNFGPGSFIQDTTRNLPHCVLTRRIVRVRASCQVHTPRQMKIRKQFGQN